MENYFTAMFEDIQHERSVMSLLSLTYSNIVKQAGFQEHDIKILKILLEKSFLDKNH